MLKKRAIANLAIALFLWLISLVHLPDLMLHAIQFTLNFNMRARLC